MAATRNASVMPQSSHSSYDAWPTPTPCAHRRTARAAFSRSARVSCFESRTPRTCSGAGTTAATVTGPAHAPRPTSSMPTTTWSPASQNFRSSRSVGPIFRVGAAAGAAGADAADAADMAVTAPNLPAWVLEAADHVDFVGVDRGGEPGVEYLR